MSTGILLAEVIVISGDRVVLQVETPTGPVIGSCRVPSLAGAPSGKWMSELTGKSVMLTGVHQEGGLIAEILVDGVPLSVLRSVADATYTPSTEYPWAGWSPRASEGWFQSFHSMVEGLVSVVIVGALVCLILVRKSSIPDRPKPLWRTFFTGFMGLGADSLSTRVELPPKTGDTTSRSQTP